MNWGGHDEAAHSGAFLALEAVARGGSDCGRFVEIDCLVDDQRILAPHLGVDALEEGLARLHPRGPLVDVQAGGDRSREVDEAGARVVDEGVAEIGVLAGKQVEHPRWYPRLLHALHELRGDDGGGWRGLDHHGVADDGGAYGGPHQDGQGEVPRGNDHPDAQRYSGGAILLTRIGVGRCGSGPPQRITGIVLAEVDGFGDTTLRLRVVLPNLERLPGGKLELVAP